MSGLLKQRTNRRYPSPLPLLCTIHARKHTYTHTNAHTRTQTHILKHTSREPQTWPRTADAREGARSDSKEEEGREQRADLKGSVPALTAANVIQVLSSYRQRVMDHVPKQQA